jgi:hypothetical protein
VRITLVLEALTNRGTFSSAIGASDTFFLGQDRDSIRIDAGASQKKCIPKNRKRDLLLILVTFPF